MAPGNPCPHCRQAGFTYLAMLFALAVFGIGLAAIGESWSAASYREREEALLRTGAAYQRAIAAYYNRSPGSVKTYPRQLADLTGDPRMVGVVRYLRTVAPDPVTGSLDWGLVAAPDGGIAGVYSRSDKTPLRHAPGAPETATAAVGGSKYSDWKFVMPVQP